VTTKVFEEIGKIRFNSVNSRKKMLKKWKILAKFTNHKIEKKKEIEKRKKKLVQRYICVHSK
jgi:hypothetical protein